LHSTYVTEQKTSLFGIYKVIDPVRILDASPETLRTIKDVREEAKKDALRTVSLFPVIMLAGYVFMILWFRSKGGYKAVLLRPVNK
jgi:hypothetical protein